MSPETMTTALLRVGLVAALVLLAWWLTEVLLLAFTGILIAVLLRAPADWLSARTRLSPNLSLALVLIVLVLVIGGVGASIAPEVGRQFDQLIAELPGAAREVTASLEQYGWGQWLLARFENAGEMLERAGAMQGAGRALTSTFGVLAGLFVIAVVGIWVTLQPQVYVEGALRLLPPPARPRARTIAGECGHVLRRWLVGCFASMLIVSAGTWVGLWALGVPLALVLAVLAGAMVFIPNFGPLIASVPAILLGLTQGTETALWVALLYVGVQAVDNTTVTPLIQRQAVSLPPALTMIAQTAMGVLAGPLGVIVAVPLTALSLVLVRRLYVEPIEGIAEAPARAE
jgi:predicted PurR-regulated permease PerM